MVQDAERKEKSENPPQLYDLTTLQRDANRLLGFTAQQTLNYAQSLYEKRLITYPRTDSRFLTEDMAESLPGLASGMAAIFGAEEKLLVHVQQVSTEARSRTTTRCCLRQVWQGQTLPPKHYNEDLLLSAMQSAGAGSMENDVERTGIGTPATRAATIEKLVQKGFLERKGDTGYAQYMTAFNRNFGGSSGGGGGGNHNNNGGGGGDGSGCGCLIAIAVVVVLILIVLGG